MNKNYVFAGIGTVVITIIVLVMMNVHPNLAEIVESKDCQELGKFDKRMDEIYGYDVNKAKAELNISNELYSKAVSLGIDCAFDAVGNMYGDNTSDEDNSKNEELMNIVIGAIQNRDCQRVLDWIHEHGYASDIGFSSKELGDIISYKTYCENFTIMNADGIDTKETWKEYAEWDAKPHPELSTRDKVNIDAVKIIQNKDCNEFNIWKEENKTYFNMINQKYEGIVMDSINIDEFDTVNIQKHIKQFTLMCKIQKLVDEFKQSNPSSLDPTEAVSELLIVFETWDCKEYDSWLKKYGKDFDYVKDRLVGKRNAHEESCMISAFSDMFFK